MLAEAGFAGLAEALTLLLNEIMRLERSQHLRAQPYERTDQRRGYANGYKAKRVRTRVGELALAVPQVREGDFYPSSLEKGLRSERALKLALAEMYVQGVSTRKLQQITEELCGFSVSSSDVSRAAQTLDEELAAWRTRPLGAYRYVFLDARYEHVRHGGGVVSLAVLVATGVREKEGKREVLGCSVSLSEQEVHWRTFLQDLKRRGLHGVRLFVSDAHEGLKQARTAVFPAVPWQRCQTHLQHNAQNYVPRQALRAEVAADIRAIFNSPDRSDAQDHLQRLLDKYAKTAPALVDWAEQNLAEGLTVFAFPEAHRRRLRTTNMVERLHKEVKRRTNVATLFPNEASCLRLVSSVLMETSQEWVTGKVYLRLQDE
ncbi:MAG: IS256 family transposase [Anaerolineales bacterium]|nr:IS256 family transposase [Anaerolineales bacterium]